MNGLSRITFSIAAAAIAMVIVLPSATPVAAAEQAFVATDISAKASPVKHRRFASIRYARHVAAATALHRDLGCSGEWCGRQFVLIIGIGF